MLSNQKSDRSNKVRGNIRFQARRLSNRNAVPGMDADDFEQDLVLDLLRKSKAFDQSRGSYATFADRIVEHRSKTLTSPTSRKRGEHAWVSLDLVCEGETDVWAGSVSTDEPAVDDAALAAIDLGRFVVALPERLAKCLPVLLSPSVVSGARELGVHRSTVHDRLNEIRQRAKEAGLSIYVCDRPDTFAGPRVCGEQEAARSLARGIEILPMARNGAPPRIHLLVTEQDLGAWLIEAKPGAALEYHRGVLAIDRLRGSRLSEVDRRELEIVAERLFRLTASGCGHLIQRRHGEGDYSYIFVLRSPFSRSGEIQ